MVQQELQQICDSVAEFLKLSKPWPEVEVKNIKGGGRIRLKTNKITIPLWAIKCIEAYRKYYVIHEVCHFRCLGHGEIFKVLEKKVLRKYGLIPIYAKAYPKKLLDLTGRVLYVKGAG